MYMLFQIILVPLKAVTCFIYHKERICFNFKLHVYRRCIRYFVIDMSLFVINLYAQYHDYCAFKYVLLYFYIYT
jgi:hypothetical protein